MSPLSKPRTVLLMEDDEAVRTLVAQVLRVKEYRVHLAEDGLEAMALLEAGGIDVVLADKNVPHLSGLELAKRVRERWPHVAVVLMTAFPEPGSLTNTPIDGYLAKPFRGLDVITRALESALERRGRAMEIEALKKQLSDTTDALVTSAAGLRKR